MIALSRTMIGEPAALSRARQLRKEMTPAERLLWKLLRNRRLRSWKFRRQKAIGFYIADFYCHELKLIVELDGDVHSSPHQSAHDENRDFDLKFSESRCSASRTGSSTKIRDRSWTGSSS